jgi:hypothetical protein
MQFSSRNQQLWRKNERVCHARTPDSITVHQKNRIGHESTAGIRNSGVWRPYSLQTQALAMARTEGQGPTIIEVLPAAEEITKANLRRVTSWCASAKSNLESMEKKLEDTVDEVTALDIEIAMADGAGDAIGNEDSHVADLNTVLQFLA